LNILVLQYTVVPKLNTKTLTTRRPTPQRRS